MIKQKTIQKKVTLSGVGLHSGEQVQMILEPGVQDQGIRIFRTDIEKMPSLSLDVHKVQATQMATTVGSEGFHVSTVEHCLAAVHGMGIDSLNIKVDGPEIPIMDGSSIEFMQVLKQAGLTELSAPKNFWKIEKPIAFTEEGKQAILLPYDGLRISCTIDFTHPAIGEQYFDFEWTEDSFEAEIARARTFGFLHEVEWLKSQGLAKGGSLDNAIVLDKEAVLNPGGLRYKDEFVRHKILDALGDLMTLGRPIQGHLILYKAGHDLMNKLIKKLLSENES